MSMTKGKKTIREVAEILHCVVASHWSIFSA